MRPTDALPHPGDWNTTSVGESIEIKRGVSWSKEQEHQTPAPGRVPVIGIKNVQDRLDLTDVLYLSGLTKRAMEKARVSAGWSVMVGSNGNRARVGNAVLIREDADYLFASFLLGVSPKEGRGLRNDYFYRWLASEQVQAYISASSEGTTGLNNLSHSFFRAMSVPFPHPDEQAAIARILDAVDMALDRTRAAVERAREVKRALAQRVFAEGVRGEPTRKTAIGHLPRSWKVVPVNNVVTAFQYGLSVPMEAKGDVAILRMGNIQDGGVLFTDLKFVSLPAKEIAPYRVRKGDVLFNRTNSQAWVGKVGIYRHDLESPRVFRRLV